MPGPVPVDANLVADETLLAIEWSDGQVLHYPLDLLRARCPCAHCVPEHGNGPPLDPESFHGVGLQSLRETGSYAFQIGFTDGHGLGIYTWAHLQAIGFPEGKAPTPKPPGAFEV